MFRYLGGVGIVTLGCGSFFGSGRLPGLPRAALASRTYRRMAATTLIENALQRTPQNRGHRAVFNSSNTAKLVELCAFDAHRQHTRYSVIASNVWHAASIRFRTRRIAPQQCAYIYNGRADVGLGRSPSQSSPGAPAAEEPTSAKEAGLEAGDAVSAGPGAETLFSGSRRRAARTRPDSFGARRSTRSSRSRGPRARSASDR